MEINTTEIVTTMNKKYNKSIELDTFKLLKDNITNFRQLNSYELLLIENLSKDQHIELILLYNKIFKDLLDLIN